MNIFPYVGNQACETETLIQCYLIPSSLIYLYTLRICIALVDVPSMGYSVVASNPEYEACSIQVLQVSFEN